MDITAVNNELILDTFKYIFEIIFLKHLKISDEIPRIYEHKKEPPRP